MSEVGDPYDLINVPTIEKYEDGFKALRDAGAFLHKHSEKSIRLRMLETHYKAPSHTLTAGELAARLELSTFRDVNRKYGKLARELCEQLDWKPVSRASLAGKKPVWLAILVSFSGGQAGRRPDEDESIRWTLLPEVATALAGTFFSHLPRR